MRLKPQAALMGVMASTLLLIGCDAAAPATLPPAVTTASQTPSVPLNAAFPLRVGETVELAAQDTVLTLAAVKSDSRCPPDAACPQAGDAVLHFSWSRSPTVRGEFDLRIGAGGSGMARFSRYVIMATALLPAPRASDPRPSQQQYQVMLKVELG